MLLLCFIVTFRSSKKGKQASFYYPRHGICEGERNKKSWHASNSHSKAKSMGMACASVCGHDSEKKTLIMSKAGMHGMCVCSGIANVQSKTFITQKACMMPSNYLDMGCKQMKQRRQSWHKAGK